MTARLRQVTHSTHARLIAAKLVLVALLGLAITEISLVTRLDTAVAHAVHGLTGGRLDDVVSTASSLGGTTTVMWLTAACAILLLALRHLRGAVALVLAVTTTQAVVAIGKALMTRPRPPDEVAVADPAGWSFPSGHSASAVALYVMVALIATTLWRRQVRPAVWFIAAGAIVIPVGLSRIYLGAHYPTDVLAGWLTGGILVLASWAACARLPARPAQVA